MTTKEIMTKNPISINKDALAVKALSLMNEKKLLHYVFIIKKISLKQLEFYIYILFYNLV